MQLIESREYNKKRELSPAPVSEGLDKTEDSWSCRNNANFDNTASVNTRGMHHAISF
jgi:hypothetical protein